MINLDGRKILSVLVVGLALAWVAGCSGGTVFGGKSPTKKISKDKKVDVLIQLGEAMLYESDYTGALNNLLEAQSLAPQNPVIHSLLGMSYLGKKEYALAESSVRKALELDPKMTNGHNDLGLIYMEQGRYEEAMREFDTCLADITFQNAFRVHNNIGIIHMEKGAYPEAIKSFKASMTLSPQFSMAYNNLGRTYMEMGQYQDALDSLKMAIRIFPKYIQAHMNLGETYERLGFYSEALEMYNRVASLAGNSPIALEAQARARKLASR